VSTCSNIFWTESVLGGVCDLVRWKCVCVLAVRVVGLVGCALAVVLVWPGVGLNGQVGK
jgi:hypothetical protein